MAIEERDTNRSLFDRRDPDTFKALVLKYASASKHTAAWFASTVTQKKQDSLLRELVAMINPYPRLMAQIQVRSRTRARRVLRQVGPRAQSLAFRWARAQSLAPSTG